MNPSRRKLRVDLLLLAALLVAAVFHLGVSRQSPDLVTALQALLSSVGLASGVDPIDEAIVICKFREALKLGPPIIGDHFISSFKALE